MNTPDALPIPDAPFVAIIANPFSGSRSNKEHVAALVAALRAEGLESRSMWGRTALSDAAKDPNFAKHCRCIVAAGGDGTVSGVINSDPAVPIVHMPLGTENLFAKHFKHSVDPRAMCRIITKGRSIPVDLARANGRRFAIVASVGFDGEVIHRLHAWRAANPDKLKRVRRITYARPMTAAFCGYKFPQLDIEADGEKFSGCLAMIFNLPRYGVGLPIAPLATPDDGLLDYFVAEKPGVFRLFGYAASLFTGGIARRPDVHRGRAKQIRIRLADSEKNPAPMQIDGDDAGFTPVDINVEPAAIRVLVDP